jgi:hypothetical protein
MKIVDAVFSAPRWRVPNLGTFVRLLCIPLIASCYIFTAIAGQVDRVVVIKVDGLPERLLERYTRESKPSLPNIAEVFGKNGTWLDNFYVRGLSLSAPSWSLLDTGRHLEIRGNVEYDRYTLRPWDYLNFFPFYVGYARSKRVDMAGVEFLDQQDISLLIDRFPYEQRYQGIQLLQRGIRWSTLQLSLKSRFTGRPVKEIFDEWQTGFSMSRGIYEATERDLLREIKGTRVRYLDYFTGEYDHVAHLTPDRVTQLNVLTSLDRLVGRLWTAIAQSPLSDTTALVLISDHGMNTMEGMFSQGYNLIEWFNSAAGGGHHVVTNRHPLTEFKLKGLDPFVSEVITPSREAFYSLKAEDYPTVVLDPDGNERANVALRENALNVVHILLDQILQKHVQGRTRTAVIDAFSSVLNSQRPAWTRRSTELKAHLIGLRRRIVLEQTRVERQPKQWTQADRDLGLDKEARRENDVLDKWRAEERSDSAYLATLEKLLSLSAKDFDPAKFKLEEVVAPKSLGAVNSIHDLQNYVIGPAEGGMVLAADGSLDFENSFRRINYFEALSSISVRNQVQKDLTPRPIESIAVPVPRETLAAAFPEQAKWLGGGIWIWRSAQKQALLLTRPSVPGKIDIRYVPVANLAQDAKGRIKFDRVPFGSGLPLELYEDAGLDAPSREWLSDWHSEDEWLRAVHRTKFSNGIIGLTEQLLDSTPPNEALAEYRRARLRTDLLVFANDHWNFNVRGFNPGGNHGSLLRSSTHSVLLFAGGKSTGIPKGLQISTPYDSLSFVPTILRLMGRPESALPGPVIQEVVEPNEPNPKARISLQSEGR